jgi:phospholipase/carboxylesterase
MDGADRQETTMHVIGPERATASLLFLHGLGADGTDLAPLADHLSAGPWRFLFPDAPIRPVALAGGMRVRAWYDMAPAGGGAAGLEDSVAFARGLLEEEIERGVPPERIVVGGFSQGGVIALETFLAFPRRLAGVVALSTYLHDHARAAGRCELANGGGPVFMAHGGGDAMIPVTRAATGRGVLEELGYAVTWRQYSMGHEICPQELRDLGAWLREALPEPPGP